MKPFTEQACNYAAYHQKAMTRYTHIIGIPLIMLSLMILLGFVRVVIIGVLDINIAIIATAALLIYYFSLQWRLALALTPILMALLWIAEFFTYEGPTEFALWSFLVLFLLGVGLQLIGHFIEENRPAFIDHFSQILIAPLVIIADVFFILGRMPELEAAISHEKKSLKNTVETT
jgi:uncharacterized membrane protein YGL010W